MAAVRFLEKTQDRSIKNIDLIKDEIKIRKQINRLIVGRSVKKRKLTRLKDKQYHIDPEINMALIKIGKELKEIHEMLEKSYMGAHIIIIPKNHEESIYVCLNGKWSLMKDSVEEYFSKLIENRRLEFSGGALKAIELDSLLCAFERSTHREYLLIVLVTRGYSAINRFAGDLMITRNGNPQYPNDRIELSPREIVSFFLKERENTKQISGT